MLIKKQILWETFENRLEKLISEVKQNKSKVVDVNYFYLSVDNNVFDLARDFEKELLESLKKNNIKIWKTTQGYKLESI